MLDSLRDKLHSVSIDFSSRLKSSTSFASSNVPQSNISSLNLDAGAELLKEYQSKWHDSHEMAEINVRGADLCSHRLSSYENGVRLNSVQMMQLQKEVNSLPRLTIQLTNLVTLTAEIQVVCEEMSSSLTYLELLCDTQKQQEAKLEARFNLALYRENKVNQLNSAKEDLASQYIDVMEKQREERQKLSQRAFDKDMQLYKSTGRVKHTQLHDSGIGDINDE